MSKLRWNKERKRTDREVRAQVGERVGVYAAGAAAAAAGMLARVTGSLNGGPRARESFWARRLVILHSIAPVPPMVAAMVRCIPAVPHRAADRHQRSGNAYRA